MQNDLNVRILDIAKRQNNIEIRWSSVEADIAMLKNKTDSLF